MNLDQAKSVIVEAGKALDSTAAASTAIASQMNSAREKVAQVYGAGVRLEGIEAAMTQISQLHRDFGEMQARIAVVRNLLQRVGGTRW
jgi:hypothetical protein